MKNKKKVVIIIQARMSSTRLPGKVLKCVLDRPLLAYLVERLKRVQLADEIVIATSNQPDDDPIQAFAKEHNVGLFRGSLNNVLDRYHQAAKAFKADIVVRICSDCPLLDPAVVNQIIEDHLTHQEDVDYTSNILERTYPRGQDVEVFSYEALKSADENASDPSEREHVTPYIYRQNGRFRLRHFLSDYKHLADQRWVVDTQEDYLFVSKIIEALYPKYPEMTLNQIIEYLEKQPKLLEINSQVEQKEVKYEEK